MAKNPNPFATQEIRDYFARFGREGGKLRAKKMTPQQRKASARKAAQARWAKVKKEKSA
jgi:hypothetical protein